MNSDPLVYIGAFTETIVFGTGERMQPAGRGISLYRISPTNGAMELVDTLEGVKNPSFLCLDPNGEHLYAVNEMKDESGRSGGGVSAFAIDPETRSLHPLNRQPSGGSDPCHLRTDREGHHLFVANYSSGSVSVYPLLPDGSLGEASDAVQHEGSSVNPDRQEGPHAHQVELSPDNRFLLVCDLGLDRVVAYRYDAETGRITSAPDAGLTLTPGRGPRHLVFSADRRFVYVINELDSTITACSYEEASGAFREIETVSALPAGYSGESSCAEIELHPSGRLLYASNRGHDSIAIFSRDGESGRLTLLGHESTRGETPRSFAIDPSGGVLLVANQDGDSLVPFLIDRESGLLRPGAGPTEAGSPVCVLFA